MVVEKLVMCLDVIVGFIVVRIAGFLRACGVIGPVGMQDVFRNAVPGLVGFFVARENVQPQGIGFIRVSGCSVKGFQIGCCPVNVTVAGDAAQPSIDRKVFAKQAAAELYVILIRTERAIAAIGGYIAFLVQLVCRYIDGCPESAGAVRRCTHTPLDLYAVGR